MSALQQAVSVQRQVLALEPTSIIYRERLGELLLRLVRQLCELNRVDEAKQLLLEREQLWPRDAEKMMKAVNELRRWAKDLKNEPSDLTGEQHLIVKRYLELSDWVTQTLQH